MLKSGQLKRGKRCFGVRTDGCVGLSGLTERKKWNARGATLPGVCERNYVSNGLSHIHWNSMRDAYCDRRIVHGFA